MFCNLYDVAPVSLTGILRMMFSSSDITLFEGDLPIDEGS